MTENLIVGVVFIAALLVLWLDIRRKNYPRGRH